MKYSTYDNIPDIMRNKEEYDKLVSEKELYKKALEIACEQFSTDYETTEKEIIKGILCKCPGKIKCDNAVYEYFLEQAKEFFKEENNDEN